MTDFTTFWSVYPKRQGSKGRVIAEKKWNEALKKGADPYWVISSAKKYANELKQMNKLNTEYVCMASTWLNQGRWEDYALDLEGEQKHQVDLEERANKRGWHWDGHRWVQTNGHLAAK